MATVTKSPKKKRKYNKRQNTTPVKAGKGENIIAYVIEEGAERPTRSDHTSISLLKKRLKPLLLATKPGQTIPIYKSERTTVRKWMNKDADLKRIDFTITTIKDNPKMVRIYRKA